MAAGTLWLVVSAAAADVSEAAATVERLHGALLEIMRNADELGFEGRRERIAPVIEQSFDFEFISRLALGRHWAELTPEQRDQMVEAFGRLSVATYAARFDGYSGEVFETDRVEQARKGRVLVRSRIETPGEPEEGANLDYLLHEVGGEWRIVNVIANGVSDLSLKRAEYGAIMRSQSFEALLELLNGQIKEYAESP